MPFAARYGHTNLIAADWQALARFYQDLFGCVPVPPERDFHDSAIAAVTGIPGAHLRGIHLRLPGGGPDGPTLEILSYDQPEPRSPTAPNRPGFAHIAFIVDDVHAARQAVLAAGGRALGETATLHISPTSQVTICYLTDPEGNIVELQTWSS